MITLAEAKEQLNIDASDNSHDAEIQRLINAAVRVVEHHTGEVTDQRTITERHSACVQYRLGLFRRPVISLTSVARVDGTQTWIAADLDPDPETGVLRVLRGPSLDGLLTITYEAGYSPTDMPANYKEAAEVIVQHQWGNQRGTAGPRIGGQDDSMNVRVGAGVGYAIPNYALELLGDPPPVVA